MSFSYAVDLELARDVVSHLASVEGRLSEVIADLHARIALLHSLWAGMAAAAHLEAHRTWEGSYAEMHDALVVMREVVHTASARCGDRGRLGVARVRRPSLRTREPRRRSGLQRLMSSKRHHGCPPSTSSVCVRAAARSERLL